MKKTLNATVSKTLMVHLNPGVTGKTAEQSLKEKPLTKPVLSSVFKIHIYIKQTHFGTAGPNI